MSLSDQTRCSPKSYAPFLPTKHLNKHPDDDRENVASKEKPNHLLLCVKHGAGMNLTFSTFLQAAGSLWKCCSDSVTEACEVIMSECHRRMTPDTEEQVGVYTVVMAP